MHSKKILIILSTIFLCGCGMDSENPIKGEDILEVDKEPAKGRYLETSYQLPTEMKDYTPFVETTDGNLISADYLNGIYLSKDDGMTWIPEENSGFTEEGNEEKKNMEIAVAPDKSVILSTYSDISHYYYRNSMGEEKEIIFKDITEDSYLSNFWFSSDNCLFAASIDGTVYEVDIEKEELKKLFEVEDFVSYLCFNENLLICADSSRFYIYDLTEGMLQKEDEVLNRFMADELNKNNTGNNFRGSGGYTYLFSSGEEKDTLYLLCGSGLYRHVLYGNTMEKIIDASFCSMGDPRYRPVSMKLLADKSFLVLYNRGLAARYVYDKEVPTVPEEELFIYSLEENAMVKQAVSIYQKVHQEVYIHYESDFSDFTENQEQSAVTREDAIRKLNQRLMSDSSPDILILDGLPMDSYIEKGILTDLSEVLGDFKFKYPQEKLFDNIVGGIRKGNIRYAVPAQFSLPIVAGRQDVIAGIGDLAAFADQMEQLRKEQPQGRILSIAAEEQFLRLFGMVSVSAWQKEDGSLDEDALTEFYTQVSRIYKAEKQGITQKDVDNYLENIQQSGYSDESIFYLQNSNNCPDILIHDSQLTLGYTKDVIVDFSDICSLLRLKENYGFSGWNGQCGKTFLPSTLLGICVNSKEPDMAADFIQLLLSEQVQGLGSDEGFPINRKSFSEDLINKWDTDYIVSYFYTRQDGKEIEYPLYWPDAEQIQQLTDIAESAENPCISNSLLENLVYQAGAKVLENEWNIQEAVSEVKSKMVVYQGN